jgi:hypothetical protein
MSHDIKLWYPAKTTANGATIKEGVIGHILWHDTLLCKGDKDKLIAEAEADKATTRMGVLSFNPICKKCEEVYKTDPRMPWRKWQEATLGKEQP